MQNKKQSRSSPKTFDIKLIYRFYFAYSEMCRERNKIRKIRDQEVNIKMTWLI